MAASGDRCRRSTTRRHRRWSLLVLSGHRAGDGQCRAVIQRKASGGEAVQSGNLGWSSWTRSRSTWPRRLRLRVSVPASKVPISLMVPAVATRLTVPVPLTRPETEIFAPVKLTAAAVTVPPTDNDALSVIAAVGAAVQCAGDREAHAVVQRETGRGERADCPRSGSSLSLLSRRPMSSRRWNSRTAFPRSACRFRGCRRSSRPD